MNESINLPKLIARLAAEAGCEPAEARRFLHHLFGLVEESLLEGETVVIKGVGEFRPSDDPSEPIMFRPDETLAAVANEPFAAFSPTELNDGVTPEMLAEQPQPAIEAVDAPVVPDTPEPAPQPEPEPEPAPEPQPAPEPEPEPVSEPEVRVVPEATPEPIEAPEESPQPVHEQENQQEFYEPEPPEIVYVEKKGANVLWLLIGILAGLVLGLVGGYFAGKYMSQYTISDDMTVESVETVSLLSDEEFVDGDDSVVKETTVADGAAADTPSATQQEVIAPVSQEQPTASAAAEPVYDTVTRSRYLTTMARDHYGKKAYWVFIFQANPQLKDPNKIAPGTKVKIPARESFAESTDQATDEKAKRILNELSRRYNL